MTDNEQYEGFLIRHQLNRDTLVLVLEDSQEGFPPILSGTVREITVTGIKPEALNLEGLKKSEGNNFWITVGHGAVEIGADFMPELKLSASDATVAKRAHDITDLRALYALMQSALTAYQKSYGLECGRTADLHARIANFISSRHDRLAAKLEFFSEKNDVKAAEFKGMLALLDELRREFE